MKRCPKCGGTKFLVTAHVTQDWYVDENGEFLETVKECDQVAHYPDDEDIWICAQCDHDGPGTEFNVPEEPEKAAPATDTKKDKALALIRQLRRFRAGDEEIAGAIMGECGCDHDTTAEFLKNFDAEIETA